MSRQAPWSVKGVDEETRQIARDAAEAAGLPIGAWIDRAILRVTDKAGTTGAATSALPGRPDATAPQTSVVPTPPHFEPPAPEPAPAPVAEPAVLARQAPRPGDVAPEPSPVQGATSALQRGRSPGPTIRHRPPPRRGSRRLLAGSLAALLLLGGGLWLVDRFDAFRPPPPETVQASIPRTSQETGRGMTAATPPEQAAPAKASPGESAPDAASPLDRLTEAARNGDAKAQHDLATLYAEGDGTPRNYEKAAELFGKAAAAGVAESDYSLGLLHEHGLGVAKDLEIAREHYRKAAAAGDEKAAARLKQIASLPEQAAPEATGLTQPTSSARERPPPAPVASPPLGREGIAEVQRLLRQLNFEPGPPDGIAGERTIDAIRLYQQFAGLAIDGKPTEALLHDLRQVAAAMKSDSAGSEAR